MTLIKLKYSLVLFLLISLFYLSGQNTTSISASDILLYEDFNDNNVHDGNPTSWDETNGSGTWNVQNGEYIGTVSPGGNPPIALAGDINWKDYSLDVDVRSIQGVDRHIFFRFTQYHVKGYSVKFRNENLGESGLIELQKHGQNVVLLTNFSFKTHIGETHHFKIVAIDNRIQIFSDGDQTPVIDYIDSSDPILEGRIGFEIEPAGINTITQTGYDNVRVTDLTASTSFDLPFQYPNRPNSSLIEFKSDFWTRLTSAFDHEVKSGIYQPFTGIIYKSKDCPNGALGIQCYDGHNGTDFTAYKDQPLKNEVFSVSEGNVVFTSEHTGEGCTPNKGGFGCVVIVSYPAQNVLGLYAHLKKISVDEDAQVTVNTKLGDMGNTGCGNCGQHLHFGVMQEVTNPLITSKTKMTKNDWKELLAEISPNTNETLNKAKCTYIAPNNTRYKFQDPTGWNSTIEVDPWSLAPKKDQEDKEKAEGCSIESTYMWKFDVGMNP
jgi:murein DD-endopeptidase MepM/ murein hydrolase activator NlpD